MTNKTNLKTISILSIGLIAFSFFASSAFAYEREVREVPETREMQTDRTISPDQPVSDRGQGTPLETKPIELDQTDRTENQACPSDAYKCWNGSCVSSIDECPSPNVTPTREIQETARTAETTENNDRPVSDSDQIPDYLDTDDDGDGILTTFESPDSNSANDAERNRVVSPESVNNDSANERGSYNNSRSNRTTATDLDSDNDIIGDLDEDDLNPPPAQDYNSTRSNRRKNSFDDGPDLDLIDRVRIDAREGRLIVNRPESATTREEAGRIDSDLYCWGRAEDGQGREYQFGRGLCVATERASEESAVEQVSERVSALQIRAQEIRQWSAEERQAWREYRANSEPENRFERFAERAIDFIEADSAIEQLTAEEDGVFLDYRAEFRVLGIFPVRRSIRASTDFEGNIEKRLPWFRFFSTQPNRTSINTILLDTMDILVRVPESSN